MGVFSITGLFLGGCTNEKKDIHSTGSSVEVSSSETIKDNKIRSEKELSTILNKMNELMESTKQTLQGFIDDPKTYKTTSVAKFSLKTEKLSKYENRINDYVKEHGKDFNDEKLDDLYTTYQENLIDISSLISDLPKEFAD